MWVMGGENGTTPNDVWYSSDDNASSWTQASTTGTMWSARSGHTAAVFDGKLWVAGGNGGSGTLNLCDSSGGSACTKVVVKDNETSRSGMESGVTWNLLYLIGGYVDNNTYKDDVLKHWP